MQLVLSRGSPDAGDEFLSKDLAATSSGLFLRL